LCALCRPTIWVFGLLVGCWWGWGALRQRRDLRECWRDVWPVALAAAATVAPWMIRNAIVLGRPILTTTHGGYTLFLGNNDVFYREVVAQPWGTVWEGESLGRWQRSLEEQMAAETPPVITETERDRWMHDQAVASIRRDPAMFWRSCWFRFRRFWDVMPRGDVLRSLPIAVRWGIAAFYGILMAGMVLGILRMSRLEWARWAPLLCLLISFTLVHLFYWSDMRMRAPLIPAIALLAARGLCRRPSKQSPPNVS
jgi:hypothetical protein